MRDITGYLEHTVDRVLSEELRVRLDGVQIGCLVEAEGPDPSVVLDGDVTVDPHDVRELFLDDPTGPASHLGHLVLADLESTIDHVLGHRAPPLGRSRV